MATETLAPLDSLSPVTGAVLGSVEPTSRDGIEAAVAGAAAVQRLWAQLRLRDRARYMARAAQAVIAEMDELAALICLEQGRPRTEALLMEILPAIDTLQWLAEEGPGVLEGERARVSQLFYPGKRARWTYEPLGVVAVLGPAAEPFATPLGDVAVALMAGNGVVLKPSPLAALAGERILRLFTRAGLPEGLLRIVHGHADTGRALVDARVAQVRFTGSLAAGRDVGEACARSLKRSVLDTGGRDAALVLADAPLERAVHGVVWAAFANAGQSGGSVERAIVVRDVAEPFIARAVACATAMTVGDPREDGVDVGPLVARDRLRRVQELLDEAVEAGATLCCGGPAEVPGLSGAFVAPAVLTGVTSSMRISREEVPGPILSIEVVDTENDAIAAANRDDAGLGASVWTADRYKGARVARELQVGMVWMNDHLVQRGAPQIPWGGTRGSGVGRARGAIALRTCAEPKAITWDAPAGRAFWWHPYDATLREAARALGLLRSQRDPDRERALKQGSPALARLALRTLRALRRR
ncbi:MAG: aldehyde dehydrogenase [Solirubrobacterales bacterium]|nr:aldehyde dehydrogenase [Solirubrobacterales bacterium]